MSLDSRIDKAKAEAKKVAPEDHNALINAMNKEFRTPSDRKKAYAKCIKNVGDKMMQQAELFADNHQANLPSDCKPSLIRKFRAGMLALLDEEKLAAGIVDITKDYWDYIKNDQFRHFIDNYSSISNDVKNKMEQNNDVADKMKQSDTTNVMDTISSVVDGIKLAPNDDKHMTRIFKAIKSIVYYAQEYEKANQ